VREGVQYGRVESLAFESPSGRSQARPQVLNLGFKVLTLQLIHCVITGCLQTRKKSFRATLIHNRFASTPEVILMLRNALPAKILKWLEILCAV
jgi:hypothetical protein